MTTQKPMSLIYTKIKKAGFNQSYINSVLPDWWDDSLADTPAGKQYARLRLARIFSLSPESLSDNSENVSFSFNGYHQFKHRTDLNKDDLTVATAIAYSAARVVSANFRTAYNPAVKLNWETVRTQLLKTSPYVTLPSLIGFCHRSGIPVVHISNFPKKVKKMAGMALMCHGRPVIVLTQRREYGYMLFDLAHELGHIAKGHLASSDASVFIDSQIDSKDTADLEGEANRYAFGLLTGQESLNIQLSKKYSVAEYKELACDAKNYGEQNAVDPTHVVLNYGFNSKSWPVAAYALKELCHNKPVDQEIVHELLMDNIDTDSITEDDLKLLTTFCGA